MYYGCKKEVEDKRDYKMKVVKSVKLPESYCLTTGLIKDQGIVNSCVAHTLSSLLEKIFYNEQLKFSVGFIYGYRPIGYSKEEGMYPREAIKTIAKIGDVLNEEFDHNKEMPEIKTLVDQNIDTLKEKAQNYKIEGYSRIYTERQIKECIFSGTPVPVSIPVRSDLKLNDKFVLDDTIGKINGYHMVLIVGWNKDGFIFQNSWGKEWGKEGIGIIPYGYDIDTAWAINTMNNNIITYKSLIQKIKSIINKILVYLKGI